jgi:cbb3-type cytochrome oxidase maturation protein
VESLLLLIPLSLLLIAFLAYLFYWSVKSGQFDDLNGPGEAILMDDDAPTVEKLDPTPDLKSRPKSRLPSTGAEKNSSQ